MEWHPSSCSIMSKPRSHQRLLSAFIQSLSKAFKYSVPCPACTAPVLVQTPLAVSSSTETPSKPVSLQLTVRAALNREVHIVLSLLCWDSTVTSQCTENKPQRSSHAGKTRHKWSPPHFRLCLLHRSPFHCVPGTPASLLPVTRQAELIPISGLCTGCSLYLERSSSRTLHGSFSLLWFSSNSLSSLKPQLLSWVTVYLSVLDPL